MATLISRATGNFTTASTWEVSDTSSELDSNSSTVAISTTNIDSAAFTPGAITVSGIAIKLNNRIVSPTGTFTVTLRNSTAGTDVTSVTVNVSDLPYYPNDGGRSLGLGWIFFKFSSSQLLAAATNYLVRCVCSNTGSQVTLWRGPTSNDVCRILATTTTASPATSDKLIITGERTGAGTGNSFTVTLNNTATTSFGPTVSGGPPQGITVSKGGTFNCENSAATNYYFKWKGIFWIAADGIVQFGVSGTPIVSTSTLTLFADSVANVDSGIVIDSGGSFTTQGSTKNHATTLTADAASSATVLTVGSTSGWAVSDALGLGPGSNSISQFQKSTILTVDSATQVTLTAGISAAKRGSDPHFTEIVNLTRNIIFTATSSSLRGYFSVMEQCTGLVRYSSFVNFGAGFTTQGKMGIDLQQMGSGVLTMEYCAWDEGVNNTPLMMLHASKTGSLYLNYNVSYKPGNTFIYINGNGLANLDCLNTTVIGTVDNSSQFNMQYINSNWKFNNTVVSGGTPNTGASFSFTSNTNGLTLDLTGKLDNCRFSYHGASGLTFANGTASGIVGTIENLQSYCNGFHGVRFTANAVVDVKFNNPKLWSNGQFGGIYLTATANNGYKKITVKNGTFAGSSFFAQQGGIVMEDYCNIISLENCTFSPTSGIYVVHSIGDIVTNINTIYSAVYEITTVDCTFGATTEFSGFTSVNQIRDFRHQRYDGVANDHRRDVRLSPTDSWTHRVDTVIFNTATPSEKITPNIGNTTVFAKSAPYFTTVNSGSSKTVNVYVRKSAVGDGAAYNGSQPRLIQKANAAIGLDSDVVLDTMTVAVGNWELLTGTTATATDHGVIEFYVDLNGTAGWVNVDDWS